MKKIVMTATVVAFIFAVPLIGSAQTPAVAPTPLQDKAAIEQRVAAATPGGQRLVAAVETRITPGRPYAGEAVTQSLQVLADGNRISRQTSTRVYRDIEGRTRREQPGPGGIGQTITISDPVAGASYMLDPSSKTAYQSELLALKSPEQAGGFAGGFARGGGGGGRGGMVARGGGPPAAGTDQAKTEQERREKERAAVVEMAETSRTAAGQMKQVLERAASGGGATTREDLGQQYIEGVLANGTRSTTVIPPGGVGNQQEIRIISEQWFSPELEVLVMTRHSDPRVGETVYRLTNVIRGNPDPSLFLVPGDYTIKQRGVRQPQ